MIRAKDHYRPSHAIKPGRGGKFKPSCRSKPRPEWAAFCTNHCPHKRCGETPCPEFAAKFGKVRNL